MTGLALARKKRRLRAAAALFLGGWGLAALALASAARAQDFETVCGPDAPLLDERLVSSITQNEVPITATFSGSELFVYGAIGRNRPLCEGETDPEIVVVVRGPSEPITVRRKERVFGVWMNQDWFRIAAAPSYYGVATTKPLSQILRSDDDRTHQISLDQAVVIAGIPNSARDPEVFRQATMRLRRAEGLYVEIPGGVSIEEGTLFQARIRLPANIIEGDYAVRVYLLRDRRVRDWQTLRLDVRLSGVERTLLTTAQERPFLYGALTLLIALLAGWGASELFRRLRR